MNTTSKRVQRRTAARSAPTIVSAALLAFGSLFAMGVASTKTGSGAVESAMRTASAKARALQPASRIEIESILLRSGVTPEALCAAGATPEQVAVIATDAVAQAQASLQALRTADIAAGTAREEKERLERQQRGGLLSREDMTALRNARAAQIQAQAESKAILDGLYAASVAGLNAQARAAMDSIRINSTWDVPVEYRVQARDETSWLALRDALADQRIGQASGRNIDPLNAQILGQAGAVPATSTAVTNLSALPQAKVAWDNAIRAAVGL